MSHPVPGHDYPCKDCGQEPDDCVCKKLKEGEQLTISQPEYSDKWECELFGVGEAMVLTPEQDKEPNWFWRIMQYLILGNKWVRKDKSDAKKES